MLKDNLERLESFRREPYNSPGWDFGAGNAIDERCIDICKWFVEEFSIDEESVAPTPNGGVQVESDKWEIEFDPSGCAFVVHDDIDYELRT